MGADSDEDEHINDIEGGSRIIGDLDISPLQTNAPEAEAIDIPYAEVPRVVDESPLFEVMAQINSLASRMKELAVVEDSLSSSVEDPIDAC